MNSMLTQIQLDAAKEDLQGYRNVAVIGICSCKRNPRRPLIITKSSLGRSSSRILILCGPGKTRSMTELLR